MTIDQVAESTNLTKGFISRIERDNTSPSVATLIRLCEVLSIPVGSLFAEPDHEVVRLDSAPRINMGGTGTSERLLSPRSESRVQLLRSHLSPDASGGDELYTVNCDVETVHVLRGAMTIEFTHDTRTVETGDSLTFSGREPHTWRNAHPAETEVLWILAPAPWSGSF